MCQIASLRPDTVSFYLHNNSNDISIYHQGLLQWQRAHYSVRELSAWDLLRFRLIAPQSSHTCLLAVFYFQGAIYHVMGFPCKCPHTQVLMLLELMVSVTQGKRGTCIMDRAWSSPSGLWLLPCSCLSWESCLDLPLCGDRTALMQVRSWHLVLPVRSWAYTPFAVLCSVLYKAKSVQVMESRERAYLSTIVWTTFSFLWKTLFRHLTTHHSHSGIVCAEQISPLREVCPACELSLVTLIPMPECVVSLPLIHSIAWPWWKVLWKSSASALNSLYSLGRT